MLARVCDQCKKTKYIYQNLIEEGLVFKAKDYMYSSTYAGGNGKDNHVHEKKNCISNINYIDNQSTLNVAN